MTQYSDGELTISEENGTQTELSGETEEPGDVPFEYDEDDPNLVGAFMDHPEGEEALKQIGDLVRKNYEEAWASTEEYRERRNKDWKIFVGQLPKKLPPFENSANVHVPVMLENMTRNFFRGYAELFGDWTNVFGVAAIGPNDETMAQVLTLHGNWQIRNQIPDFRRQQMKGMLTFFSMGDVTCHSYYDPVRKQNRHEMLSTDEFIVPFTYTSMMPDYSDVPYRIKIFKAYPHELEEYSRVWENVEEFVDEHKNPTFDTNIEQPLATDTAREQGVEPDETESAAPYTLLWWEGWLELPNQDRRRWCQVIADKDSDKIFKLTIFEHVDWQDQARFETQMQELSDWRNQTQAMQQMIAEQSMQIDEIRRQVAFARDTMAPEQQAVEEQLRQAEAIQGQIQPPPPPTWLDNPDDPEARPKPARKVPIHLFAHGVCIEPLAGNLGIGYGHMLADFNRAANTALSQFTDQATLSNIWSLIVDETLDLGGDQLQLSPGKIIRATGMSGSDLNKAIVPLKPGAANPQLYELVGFMRECASGAMQSPSVLSGEPGKSGETFRGISARIEQATKQLSVSTRKYADFLETILKNNAFLNSIYLDDEEFFHIALQSGSPFWNLSANPEAKPQPSTDPNAPPPPTTLAPFRIGRKMYERNYHVEIRSDLRFVSQSQKIQEADELVAMGSKIPFLQQNPVYQYHAVRKALLARGQNEMVATLGPPPQVPTPPPPGAQPPQGAAPPGARPPQGAPAPNMPAPPPGAPS